MPALGRKVIEALPVADLLKKHVSLSEEDFAKEPLRNRDSSKERYTRCSTPANSVTKP